MPLRKAEITAGSKTVWVSPRLRPSVISVGKSLTSLSLCVIRC